MNDKRFGIGIMEMAAPYERYKREMEYWYASKPVYPGKDTFPTNWRARLYRLWWRCWQANQVLMGRAVAIRK